MAAINDLILQMQAVSEPVVIFNDIDAVSEVLAMEGMPNGTYAVGTGTVRIKLIFLESESDHLYIAIRHQNSICKLPLIKMGFKGSYSLCCVMPGCGPVDLRAFKVLWNSTHGYNLRQFEDEAGNRVKLEVPFFGEVSVPPIKALRVSWTSRPRDMRPSPDSDSDSSSKPSADASETKEVSPLTQTDCAIDKEDNEINMLVQKDTSSSDDSEEEEHTSQNSSEEDYTDAEAELDKVDDTGANDSGQLSPAKKSESKTTENSQSEMAKSRHIIRKLLTSLLPEGFPVIAKSFTRFEAKMGKGHFSIVPQTLLRLESKTAVGNAYTKVMEYAAFGRHVHAVLDLEHQNVLSLQGVCLDGCWAMILTDYIDGGTLLDYLKGPNVRSRTDGELVDMALQVAQGMEYISLRGWRHGDLTSTNVLLTSALECKITGFGLATVPKKKNQCTVIYPHSYGAAIEVHQDKEFTFKSDVWSFGILFMEIMSRGQTPYRGRVDPTQLKVYLEIGNRWECPDDVSEEHYNIMQRCWKLKHRARPSFQQLVTLLSK